MLQVPGQGPTSYLDAAQREKALQQMQQMSSAQIVSATAHMQPRMGPPVTYGGFWQHPGLGQTSPHDVKPFAQNPFLHSEKTPTSLGMGMGGLTGPAQPSSPAWQGRSIGNNRRSGRKMYDNTTNTSRSNSVVSDQHHKMDVRQDMHTVTDF